MSMDPGMMQQILAQAMSGGGQQQPAMGGMVPQVSPLQAGADLARKAMLISALRQTPQQPRPQPIAQANPALQQMNPMTPPNPTPGMQNV
jgi:hypothetical protein